MALGGRLMVSHYVRVYVWGAGEVDLGGAVLRASNSISSKVEGRIVVGRQLRSRLETVEFNKPLWGIHSVLD